MRIRVLKTLEESIELCQKWAFAARHASSICIRVHEYDSVIESRKFLTRLDSEYKLSKDDKMLFCYIIENNLTPVKQVDVGACVDRDSYFTFIFRSWFFHMELATIESTNLGDMMSHPGEPPIARVSKEDDDFISLLIEKAYINHRRIYP